MNKKEYLGIILIALASISIILFLYSNNRELKKANTMLQLEKQVLIDNTDSFEYLNSITVDTFENRIKNKEDIFVYIGNSECADCSTFSKNLKNEVNNFPLKNSLYLVEISRLHRNKKKWTEFKLKYGFDQTPAFILFKNGKVISMIQWDEKKGLSSDSFHRWLEENRNDIENLS